MASSLTTEIERYNFRLCVLVLVVISMCVVSGPTSDSIFTCFILFFIPYNIIHTCMELTILM